MTRLLVPFLLLIALPGCMQEELQELETRVTDLEEENEELRADLEELQETLERGRGLGAPTAGKAGKGGKAGKAGKGPAGRMPPGGAESFEGVTRKGPTEFVVTQSVIDASLPTAEAINDLVTAAPHMDETGAVDGYVLSDIRRGSVTGALGFRNGDVVHAINGEPLTTPKQARLVYDSLSIDATVVVELSRAGSAYTVEFQIVNE